MRIYVTLLVAITMLSVSFAETIEKDENVHLIHGPCSVMIPSIQEEVNTTRA